MQVSKSVRTILNTGVVAACLVTATLSASTANAALPPLPRSLTEFHATLLQLNEPGGVPFTGAYGAGSLLFDAASAQLSYVVNIEGIPAATMTHIHKGNIGVNGPVIIDLLHGAVFTPAVTLSGTVALTPSQVADLYAGNYYINVHTLANPGGEIRGQVLVNDASRAFGALLSGATEVPANASTSTGTATVALSDNLSQIAYFLSVTGALTPTMSHIHTGTVGVAGPIAVPLSGAFNPGDLISGTGALAPDQVQTLLSGGYYVNVHSTAFPGGELRGQLYPRQQEFTALLSGANEVPPVPTNATGLATLDLDNATGQIDFVVSEVGIDAPTMAHIHEAPVGVNGPVKVDLLALGGGMLHPDMPLMGSTTLTPAQISTMKSEGFYVNVHSLAHPGGEIRGQVVEPKRYLVFQANLNGANEAPTPVTTTASGFASMVLDTSTNGLTYYFATQGITPTMAHIHTGTVGVAGGILFPLNLSGTGVVTLTEAQAFVLANDGYYVNVHSAAFPGGEIRGQLNPQVAPATFAAVLGGQNEVPPVSTTATGGAFLVLDPTQTQLTYYIAASNILSVTASHIHHGAAGVNGPVTVGFPNATSLTNNTPISGTVSLTPAILNDLLTNQAYVNVHTTANPGGAIRGQTVAVRPMSYLPIVIAPSAS